MGVSKEPIKLRKRKTPSGSTSLYIDIYLNGERSYEYLKLYLIPEKTKADKDKNRRTLQLAEAIKSKRVVELQNGEFGFNAAYKLDTNFLDYYRMMCEKRHGNPESRGNWGNWYSRLKHLERYCKPSMTFKSVTPEWVEGFKEYLDNTARCRDKRKHITTDEVTKPLWETMASSSTGSVNKLVPKTVTFARKTGYSGANDKGIIAAQNDVGIIEFEDSRRVAYAIFLTDSSIGVDSGYEVLAQIGKAIWKAFEN